MVGMGLLAMYVPTFWDLFHGLWRTDQQGQGPVVLCISLWLIWRAWPNLLALPEQPQRTIGWFFLVFGLLLYFFGRSQAIQMAEVGALLWLLIAVLLILRGVQAVKLIWFALFFMIFMIPLPGFIIDSLTQPLKLAVSFVAEAILHTAGYPISRTGVILQVGQYQLLVADACAGLQTLFTLEALGLLYLNMIKYESPARNISLAMLIIPISFAANVIRVVVLTLVTYHYGDAAGQGFVHDFAGIVLFMAALLLTIGADASIRMLISSRSGIVKL